MKLHSQVGLITNSSSEVYSWPDEKTWRQDLLSAGQVLLDAMGINEKAEDYFDVVQEMNARAEESFFDDPESYIEEGHPYFAAHEALNIEFGLDPEEGYMWEISDADLRSDYAAKQLVLFNEHIADKIDFLDSDGYRANFDVFLVVKSTGNAIDFQGLFGKIYNQEAYYN